jgi:hypothetical protein
MGSKVGWRAGDSAMRSQDAIGRGLALLGALAWLLGGAPEARAGGVEFHGKLTPPESVQKVLLLDRDVPQGQVQTYVKVNEIAAEFASKTGEFVAKGLEAGKTYALYVELKDGTKIEGVDLRPKVADETPMTEYGRTSIETHIYGMKSFYNETRILEISANGKSAAVLLELGRTSNFNNDGGDVIWRIERWDYVQEYGAWKPETKTKVLRRFRMPAAEWPRVKWYFVSGWGVLTPGAELRTFEIPDLKATPGRYPGVPKSEPKAAQAAAKKKHEESLTSEQDPELKPAEK